MLYRSPMVRQCASFSLPVVSLLLLVTCFGPGTPAAESAVHQITVNVHNTGALISPLLFSVNLEHTRYAMWKGLSAQLLANRKFAGENLAGGWNNTSWRRGMVGADGVVARWFGIGGPAAQFAPDTEELFTGKQSQRIQIVRSGVRGGIGQEEIPLQVATKYTARFQIKSNSTVMVSARLTDATAKHEYVNRAVSLEKGDWREWTFDFEAPETDLHAKLEITFKEPGTLWVGSASLMPADNFQGMRADVIDRLKEISPPLIRWPGGNFTRNYRWKEGLLPVDRRPPIQSGWGPTLPFTDHNDFHEVGVDQYIALCRELECESCITLWMGEGGAREAADWVEYCNGSAETRWGRIRAQRGYREPYGIKYWMIGNEIFGRWMSGNPYKADGYADAVREYSAAIKEVDPSLVPIAVGWKPQWNQTVIANAGGSFDILALPRYAPITKALTGANGALEFTRQARRPRKVIGPWLAGERRDIDELGAEGKRIQLMLAEWNIKHDWFNYPFVNQWHVGPIDAAFAAAQLNMLCREAEGLNMTLAAMFQPVNEGAIRVKPFSAELTAMGQVLALYRVHRGGRLLNMSSPTGDRVGQRDPPDIDACASLSADGKRLSITLVSTAAAGDQLVRLLLPGGRPAGANATVLSVNELQPDMIMNQETEMLAINDEQNITFSVPRFGIVLLQVELGD